MGSANLPLNILENIRVKHSQIQQIDRCRGAMFGLAIGDALGAPVEMKQRGTFKKVEGFRAGGYFRLPAGAWTDDTAMALCLADSLCGDERFQERDLLDRFNRWGTFAENTSTGRCIGAGKNTVRAIGHYHRTGQIEAPRFGRQSDGNGVLMRTAPVVIRLRNDRNLAREISLRQGRTTHASAISEAACDLLVDLLFFLIGGDDWHEAVAKAESLQDNCEVIERSRARHSANDPPSTGYVLDTLQAALWAVEHAGDPSDALLTAVNLGGDADTVGAVTGQIAGARWGLSAFPTNWVAELARSDLISEKTERLLAMD